MRPFSSFVRHFNPRSRKGSDHGSEGCRYCICNFNPRSRKGSDHIGLELSTGIENFNPRSRKGSDSLFTIAATISKISIHAPAKGATDLTLGTSFPSIFQSTLPQRERLLLDYLFHIHTIFQSTLPQRERRTWFAQVPLVLAFQSTLPQRERLLSASFPSIHTYFNPRSRKGSDRQQSPIILSIFLFQSTLPQRERLFISPYILIIYNFNPRSRKGSDAEKRAVYLLYRISIHAPAKGATAIFHKIMNYYCETPPNNTQINPLNFNAKYINKIKISVLSCFFLVRITQ